MAVMDCPARVCGARFEPIVEQLRPEDDELTTERIPLHDLVAAGLPAMRCPASLLPLPLNLYIRTMLLEQSLGIESMVPPVVERAPEHEPTDLERFLGAQPGGTYRNLLGNGTEHGRTPKPTEDGGWFRPRESISGHNPHAGVGPTGRPKLQFLPTPPAPAPTTPQEGGAMSTVEEVRDRLTRAQVLIAEAQQMMHPAIGKLSEALELINLAREGSSGALGAPAIGAAASDMEQAFTSCGQAIEEITTYKETM